ncbi:hypothetical protein [Comamonas sp. UBA7528]|uniref:hypothetical protein n=1 Tax=Comamonas sp. UBA7528 TaxID=1946391 RepID=UPI0025B890E0|nr:hypothetical protein [Comamonas sp. UBA7528]
MIWEKIGKIFDPSKHNLSNNCKEYAQSPQTLILEDRVRIFFSTRSLDEKGKFLSHIAYVDFSRNMKNILGTSSSTVIPLGEKGCFDEHGIFPINIYQDDERIIAYTTGWNRKVSVSVDTSIGLAISHDKGHTFEKYGAGGPIVTANIKEPFLVGDAFVKKYHNIYYMWYIYGSKWIKKNTNDSAERVYKIAQATSVDGITWNRDSINIIQDTIDADECQALPSVIFHNGLYHMYFCYRDAYGFRTEKGKGYRIGYAYSSDLKKWNRDDRCGGIELSQTGWDSDMQCYPHIFQCDGQIFLLYNGNEFGRGGFGLAILTE